jgi:hypothetical protein
MSDLAFEVLGARAEPFAAVPTIMFRLRITERTGAPVHAVALRCQIRIEPQLRRYGSDEEARLVDVFGEPPQWGQSLSPFLWTHVATMLTGFTGVTEIDLPVTCTYDLEVSGTKYFHSLDRGEIPLVLLFSGTTFVRGDAGVSVAPVAWHEDASYRLPVQVWRDMMNVYFPNSGWLMVSRDTLDALTRFKVARALPTWDHVVEQLVKEAGEEGA